MSLLQRIKDDQVQALKDRNKVKRSSLTTLYSEAANVGLNDGKRESTDAEVVAVVKKFLNNIEDTIKALDDVPTHIIDEQALFAEYLPTQMTEDQIVNAIELILVDFDTPTMKDMGKVMSALKNQHAGQYDGGLASKLVRGSLTS